MKYKVTFRGLMPKGSKLVIPISLGQPYHSGDRLKVLAEFAKDYEATFVIADTLHRHNTDYKTAADEGEKFLEEHKEILKGCKITRWDDWITGNREKEFNDKKAIIEQHLQKDSSYYGSLVKTAKKVLAQTPLENSIEYLKEECAVLLMFNEFDYHIYPKMISDCMAYTYELFALQKPQYRQIHFDQLQATNIMELGALQKRKENSLPLALRIIYSQLEAALNSSEIPEKSKEIFINHVNNLFKTTVLHNRNNKAEEIDLGSVNRIG